MVWIGSVIGCLEEFVLYVGLRCMVVQFSVCGVELLVVSFVSCRLVVYLCLWEVCVRGCFSG